MKRIKVSREFLIRLKLDKRNAYEICQEAGINPPVLSRLIHGAEAVRPFDSRIVEVGKLLGLSADACFEFVEVPKYKPACVCGESQ